MSPDNGIQVQRQACKGPGNRFLLLDDGIVRSIGGFHGNRVLPLFEIKGEGLLVPALQDYSLPAVGIGKRICLQLFKRDLAVDPDLPEHLLVGQVALVSPEGNAVHPAPGYGEFPDSLRPAG
ncbi:hypothetical protein D3C76_1164230 [compost metagenome]